MIYLKTELKDGKELKVDVYGDEFYCLCPGCGKEVHLDDEMVKRCASDGDFGSPSFYCNECTKKRTMTLGFCEFQQKNINILTAIFEKVGSESLRTELYNALDTYNQLVYNYLSDLKEREKEWLIND